MLSVPVKPIFAMEKKEVVQIFYLFWKLRDLLKMRNRVEIEGMKTQSFKYSFDNKLSYSLLHGFIKVHKLFLSTRDIPQCFPCPKSVKTLFLVKRLNKTYRLAMPTDTYSLLEQNVSASSLSMTGEYLKCFSKNIIQVHQRTVRYLFVYYIILFFCQKYTSILQ